MYLTIHPNINNPQVKKSTNIQIKINELEQFNKNSIIKLLKNKIDINKEIVNFITKSPRNYLYDKMISQNQQLNQNILPITLEIIFAQQAHEIKSFKQVTVKNFNILEKIGQGTFAQIFLVERIYDKNLFAMKRISKTSCLQKGNFNFIRHQEDILKVLRCKWITKLYYSFQNEYYVYFILEYCPYGDLHRLLHTNTLSLNLKYTYFIQTCLALTFLHSRGFIYRDIKPQNILIDVNGMAKLCDFGYARQIDDNQHLTQLCGSYEYIAPQIIDKKSYGKGVDLYCLGLLFYQILNGSNPYEGITPQNIKTMKEKTIIFDKKKFSISAKDLIQKLMRKDPQKRVGYMNTHQIFLQNFFKENQNLVINIIGEQIIPPQYKYQQINMKQRNQLVSSQQSVLSGCYNYLTPLFDVDQKFGPKFSFNF